MEARCTGAPFYSFLKRDDKRYRTLSSFRMPNSFEGKLPAVWAVPHIPSPGYPDNASVRRAIRWVLHPQRLRTTSPNGSRFSALPILLPLSGIRHGSSKGATRIERVRKKPAYRLEDLLAKATAEPRHGEVDWVGARARSVETSSRDVRRFPTAIRAALRKSSSRDGLPRKASAPARIASSCTGPSGPLYPVPKTTGVSCPVAARFHCRSSPRQVESAAPMTMNSNALKAQKTGAPPGRSAISAAR
jgi:hypothetical protein